MPGLLSDVLPFVYSQGNRAKRYIGGLLSDPVAELQQTAGKAVDDLNAVSRLTSQAIDPRNPAKIVNRQAFNQLADQYMNSMLNFAPVGATVWHGSPHKFDKFDSSKIGTGEGAQAYGHGLYLAESPSVAKQYRDALSTSELRLKDGGEYNPSNPLHLAAAELLEAQRNGIDKFTLAQNLRQKELGYRARNSEWANNAANETQSVWQSLFDSKLPTLEEINHGSLYKVDLPDDAIAKMLDWDKPLSQQAPEVRAAWDSFVNSPSGKKYAKELAGASNLTRSSSGGELTGESLMKNLMGANEAKNNYQALASEYFRSQGIPGIRYLDGGSRGAGAGTSNFVVFPGNEGLLTILERNGKPLGLLED